VTRVSGKVSVVQVLALLVLAAAAYGAFMYFPLLTHRMALGTIAREAASKMLIEHNDGKIREEIFERAKRETGVQIGMSELFLSRSASVHKTIVTIRWTEQVKHVWGKNHVIKMQVQESAEPGAVKFGKNAE